MPRCGRSSLSTCEAIELALELLGAVDVLHGQELLHGLVEALDLSTGLWVVGPGVLGLDAEGEELLFGYPATWWWRCVEKMSPLSLRKEAG